MNDTAKSVAPPATDKKETLAILNDIIRAYKKVIASDDPELAKLSSDLTKPYVTASSIIRRLNRAK